MAAATLLNPAPAPGQVADRAWESHWSFYAVDVKKKVKPEQVAIRMCPRDVRKLIHGKEHLCRQNPVPLVLGDYEIRVVQLAEMQTPDPPGWWDQTTPTQYSLYFSDENVVVQQRKELNAEGKKPWRLIVRVPNGSPLERKLSGTSLDWSTESLVHFSGCHALFQVGHFVNNDDLPIFFTGKGGVNVDMLAHLTRYELFDMQNGYQGGAVLPERECSIVPPNIFRTDEPDGQMIELYEANVNGSVCAISSLKWEFCFDRDGQVHEVYGDGLLGWYYGRVFTKTWWFLVVCKNLTSAILVVVDLYSNVLFWHSLPARSSFELPFAIVFIFFYSLVL